MAGVRTQRTSAGKWRGWFMDAAGRQRWFTGTRSKPETRGIARRLEDEQRLVKLGYVPAFKISRKERMRPIDDVLEVYLTEGEAHGGRNGMPWSPVHAHERRTKLHFWVEKLVLETCADLEGVLPQVERVLGDLLDQGRAGKTVKHYAETLRAFCEWCMKRGYLQRNPLAGQASFDATPQKIRRALTEDEIERLLKAAPDHRRLLYEVALCTGLRARELRLLQVGDLDAERHELVLRPEITKNRKAGRQPLAAESVRRLQEFISAGTALDLYRRFHASGIPADPLVYVPSSTAREFNKDSARAGIEKRTSRGSVDFHCLRVTFATLMIEQGATPKEAQHMARHATPQLTMNTYARTRDERLVSLAERVANVVISEDNYAHSMHKAVAEN